MLEAGVQPSETIHESAERSQRIENCLFGAINNPIEDEKFSGADRRCECAKSAKSAKAIQIGQNKR